MGVTVAGDASLSACQVPKVGAAAVTTLSFDIWQTLALATGFVAQTVFFRGALTPFCPQEVADTFSAVASGCIAIVTIAALLTKPPFCVVQALKAQACAPVAGPSVGHVDIVVTLAGQTASSSLEGVSVESRSALVTP